jgi:lysophospholipase L1-like esterase
MAARTYVAEGASNTLGFGVAYGYAGRFASNFAVPGVDFTNVAVNGSVLADFVTRAATVDALYSASKPCLLSLAPGNDIATGYAGSGGSRTAWLSALASYLDARRAVGFKVILCSILPRTAAAAPGFNAERALCNAVTATWLGSHCDAYCDFAADPVMGPDGAASNASVYQADGVHPTLAGQDNLTTLFAAAANAVGVRHRVTW